MIRVNVSGHLAIRQRLQLLTLPAAKRRRLLGQVSRQVRTSSRKRLRAQRDPHGNAWAPRNDGSRKKMLRGLSKGMTARATPEAGRVSFNNLLTGNIARQHQEGENEVMTADKMARIHGRPDYDAPCTRKQARALRVEGYKVRRKSGKGYKKASLRELTERLTLGQAGVILRHMRDDKRKRSWVIPLPARAFLGASESDISNMVQTVFNQTINARP